MSAAKHSRIAVCFFWIAMAMTLACIGLILFHETKLIRPLERRDFPLSGVFAGAAFLAFLATELCDSLSRKPHHQSSPPAPPVDEGDNTKVSKQEFMSLMEEEFDRLDKDKRGVLNRAAVPPGELLLSRLNPERDRKTNPVTAPAPDGTPAANEPRR